MDRLCRRKRIKHPTDPSTDLGTTGPDSVAAGNVQLEKPFDHRGHGFVAILLSNLSRQHQELAGSGVSQTSPTPRSWQAAGSLGRGFHPSQRRGPRLRCQHSRKH